MFSKKKKELENDVLDTQDIDVIDDGEEMEEEAELKPKKKLPAWVIAPVIGVIAVAGIGASIGSVKGNTNKGGTQLQVVEVKQGDVQEVYNSKGTIESENTKTYYSPVTAPIAKCDAVVGKMVKAGDLLVTFDTANLERDNEQAQATLQTNLNASQASRARNAKTISEANAASADLVKEANRLADETNQLKGQMDAAYVQFQANAQSAAAQSQQNQAARAALQTRIANAQSEVTRNQDIMNAVEQLYPKEKAEWVIDHTKHDDIFGEKSQYGQASKARDAAQAELNAANSELSAIQDPAVDDAGYGALQVAYDAKYKEWEAAYKVATARKDDPGMTSAELEGLNLSDNAAELSALSPAELLQKGREGMKADINGVIASVATTETNTATQGVALFTIASADQVRVKLEVSPDDYEKVVEGNSAIITVGKHTYNGTVTYVNKIAIQNEKGNPVIGAQIHVNNPDENICIGATAKIKIIAAESKDVLLVPTEAINASTEGDFVYVIENGVVKEKPVELGTTSTTEVEVKSGLKKGDKVVNDLNVDIKEGMSATAKEVKSK